MVFDREYYKSKESQEKEKDVSKETSGDDMKKIEEAIDENRGAAIERDIEERKETLEKIQELEKKSGINLDKTEREIENEIKNDENSLDKKTMSVEEFMEFDKKKETLNILEQRQREVANNNEEAGSVAEKQEQQQEISHATGEKSGLETENVQDEQELVSSNIEKIDNSQKESQEKERDVSKEISGDDMKKIEEAIDENRGTAIERDIEERKETLEKIQELEKKSGINLDKTEREIENEIKNDENSLDMQTELNPAILSSDDDSKPESKLMNAESNPSKLRNELIKHVSSQEYLDKLKLEVSDDKKAKKIQKERIENLKNVKINALSLEELEREYVKQVFENTGSKLDITNINTAGFYNEKEHEVFIPNDKFDPKEIETIIWHELGHAKTGSNTGITDNTKKILTESFKEEKGDSKIEKEYFINPTERLVRKQILDRELEALGIKKYGEKFADKHYDKMMEYYKKGKFSWNANEFIKRTNRKNFKKIFNEIAANEDEKSIANA